MQFHSPFNLSHIISYVGNKRFLAVTERFPSPLKSVRAGFNCTTTLGRILTKGSLALCLRNNHFALGQIMDLSCFEVYYGPVSTRDNRVLKGPLGRSLRSFARTAHSLHSAPLCSACLARSLRSWARSLTPSWLKFMNMCLR